MESSNELTPAQTKILEGLKLEKDATGKYTLPALTQLYDATVAWGKDEFTGIASTFRKERRAADTQQAYVEAHRSFSDNVATLLEKCQRELLGKLGIEISEFEKSVVAYMEEGKPEIYELDNSLPRKMNASLSSTAKSLEGINVKDVLKEKTEYLDKNAANLKKYALFAGFDELSTIVQSKLHDFVHEKFGIEEEDFVAIFSNSPDLLKDSEVQDLMSKYQKQLDKITQF